MEQHPAVPIADVLWLSDFMKHGNQQPVSFHDALLLLRRKLFPFAHDPYKWIEGK
jgi:hypothetical protein